MRLLKYLWFIFDFHVVNQDTTWLLFGSPSTQCVLHVIAKEKMDLSFANSSWSVKIHLVVWSRNSPVWHCLPKEYCWLSSRCLTIRRWAHLACSSRPWRVLTAYIPTNHEIWRLWKPFTQFLFHLGAFSAREPRPSSSIAIARCTHFAWPCPCRMFRHWDVNGWSGRQTERSKDI